MSHLKKEIIAWAKKRIRVHSHNTKPKHLPEDLPEEYTIPNSRHILVKDQSDVPSCTSHAISSALEFLLSNQFNEQVVIDAKDLWDKQLQYGAATDHGDTIIGALFIADKYGVKFETKSGVKGVFFPSKGVEVFPDPLAINLAV
jgi:hypothetical protein